jgi:hypothetical protein
MKLPLALLGLCCVLSAADLGAGWNAIRQTDLRADIAFLSSDALKGRLSLRRGGDAAAQFVAAEFAKAGLKPAAGNSFFQPVPLAEYNMDWKRSSLAIIRDGVRKEYVHAQDYWGGFTSETTVRGPVVFAGYGITAPEYNYDDYAGLDARGKVVLVFEHEPQENDPASVFNGVGNTRYANNLMKVLNAQKHGAIGVIAVSEPNRKHRSTHQRMAAIPGGEERMRLLKPQGIVDGEARIPIFFVSDELAAEMISVARKKPSDLQSSIDASLRPASMPLPGVELDLRIALSERSVGESPNVAGILEGSDPNLKGETVIFCAHYDHDGAWDGRIRPGADDDASGTAGVIALARAYARNRERPKRSLLFLVFTAEERGMLGSYYYAAHPLRPLAGTRAVINFDMISRNEAPSKQTDGVIEIASDTSNELGLIGTNYSPDYRAVVERENKEVGLRLTYKWDKDAALNVFQRSDQFPFAVHDIPAVWWFTGFHPDYHQTTDTVDRLNFPKMEKILRLAYLTGWRFADNPRPPAFVAKP